MCTPNTGKVYFIEGHAKGPVSGYLRILGQRRWTCKIRQQGKRKGVSIALISFLFLLSLLKAMSVIIRRRRVGINGQLEGFSHKIFNKSSFIALPQEGISGSLVLSRSCVISKAQCIGMWLYLLLQEEEWSIEDMLLRKSVHMIRGMNYGVRSLVHSWVVCMMVAKRMPPEVIYSVWRVPLHLHVVNH